MGVIAFILLSQRKPFFAKTRSQTKEKILRCQYNFNATEWNHISQDAKDFVSSLLVLQPSDRLTAKQALEHPWLKSHSDDKRRTSVEYRKQTSLMNHVHNSILGYARMSELKRIASVVVAHKSSSGKQIFTVPRTYLSLH
jgi:serine/threonine protein kinase